MAKIYFTFQNDLSLTKNTPTGPFTKLELQDQEIGEFCVAQERRATDYKASNL